jgi:ISXO2 transposase-like protein
LNRKLREAVAAESRDHQATGHVQVDGAYFGGYVKPVNRREDRIDRRLLKYQSGKRRVVVIMRERDTRGS